MRRLKLCVGDWSLDGHNQFRDFYYETTLEDYQLGGLWASAVEEMGFDLLKQFREYEENQLSPEYAAALEKYLTIEGVDGEDGESEDPDTWFCAERFAEEVSNVVQVAMQKYGITGEFKLAPYGSPNLSKVLSRGEISGVGYGLLGF